MTRRHVDVTENLKVSSLRSVRIELLDIHCAE